MIIPGLIKTAVDVVKLPITATREILGDEDASVEENLEDIADDIEDIFD